MDVVLSSAIDSSSPVGLSSLAESRSIDEKGGQSLT